MRTELLKIPDKSLDGHRPRGNSVAGDRPPPPENPLEETEETDDEAVAESEEEVDPAVIPTRKPLRRLSTYEFTDGGMDLESDIIGGSARR